MKLPPSSALLSIALAGLPLISAAAINRAYDDSEKSINNVVDTGILGKRFLKRHADVKLHRLRHDAKAKSDNDNVDTGILAKDTKTTVVDTGILGRNRHGNSNTISHHVRSLSTAHRRQRRGLIWPNQVKKHAHPVRSLQEASAVISANSTSTEELAGSAIAVSTTDDNICSTFQDCYERANQTMFELYYAGDANLVGAQLDIRACFLAQTPVRESMLNAFRMGLGSSANVRYTSTPLTVKRNNEQEKVDCCKDAESNGSGWADCLWGGIAYDDDYNTYGDDTTDSSNTQTGDSIAASTNTTDDICMAYQDCSKKAYSESFFYFEKENNACMRDVCIAGKGEECFEANYCEDIDVGCLQNASWEQCECQDYVNVFDGYYGPQKTVDCCKDADVNGSGWASCLWGGFDYVEDDNKYGSDAADGSNTLSPIDQCLEGTWTYGCFRDACMAADNVSPCRESFLGCLNGKAWDQCYCEQLQKYDDQTPPNSESKGQIECCKNKDAEGAGWGFCTWGFVPTQSQVGTTTSATYGNGFGSVNSTATPYSYYDGMCSDFYACGQSASYEPNFSSAYYACIRDVCIDGNENGCVYEGMCESVSVECLQNGSWEQCRCQSLVNDYENNTGGMTITSSSEAKTQIDCCKNAAIEGGRWESCVSMGPSYDMNYTTTADVYTTTTDVGTNTTTGGTSLCPEKASCIYAHTYGTNSNTTAYYACLRDICLDGKKDECFGVGYGNQCDRVGIECLQNGPWEQCMCQYVVNEYESYYGSMSMSMNSGFEGKAQIDCCKKAEIDGAGWESCISIGYSYDMNYTTTADVGTNTTTGGTSFLCPEKASCIYAHMYGTNSNTTAYYACLRDICLDGKKDECFGVGYGNQCDRVGIECLQNGPWEQCMCQYVVNEYESYYGSMSMNSGFEGKAQIECCKKAEIDGAGWVSCIAVDGGNETLQIGSPSVTPTERPTIVNTTVTPTQKPTTAKPIFDWREPTDYAGESSDSEAVTKVEDSPPPESASFANDPFISMAVIGFIWLASFM
eukprot:scaffold115660_cov45-Cyclotella_meneghiniana.AAC.1